MCYILSEAVHLPFLHRAWLGSLTLKKKKSVSCRLDMGSTSPPALLSENCTGARHEKIHLSGPVLQLCCLSVNVITFYLIAPGKS